MECKNCGTLLYDGNIECIKCNTDNTPYLKEAGILENPDADKLKKECFIYGLLSVIFALITDSIGITLVFVSGFNLTFLLASIVLCFITLVLSAISVKSAIELKKTYQFAGRAKVGYVMGLSALNFAAAAIFLLFIALVYFLI